MTDCKQCGAKTSIWCGQDGCRMPYCLACGKEPSWDWKDVLWQAPIIAIGVLLAIGAMGFVVVIWIVTAIAMGLSALLSRWL